MSTTQRTQSLASGTRQNQRQLAQLLPDSFSVEERDTQQWLEYLQSFAAWLTFYAPEGAKGNWQALLDEPEGLGQWAQWLDQQPGIAEAVKQRVASPDRALLLAFLKLLRHPRDQFRRITGRHLTYYYRQVLGFTELPAEGDKAQLILTLEDGVPPQTLPENTLFDGGDDTDGEKRLYRLTETTGINHAQVASVRTLGLDTENNDTGFLRTELVSLESGLLFPTGGALTFGEFTEYEEDPGLRQSRPDIGLLLTSPLLWLAEGVRVITATFHRVTNPNLGAFPDPMTDLFEVAVSTAEGPVTLSPGQISLSRQDDAITLTLTLDALFPAVTTVPEPISTNITAPFIQLTLKADAKTLRFPEYQSLKEVALDRVALAVNVSGLQQVLIRNDLAPLDPAGPMELFGGQPRVGSNFQFSHPELAIKPLSSLSVDINWANQPDDLYEYYDAYRQYLQNKSHPDASSWPLHRVNIGSNWGESGLSDLYGNDGTSSLARSFSTPSDVYPDGLDWWLYRDLPHASPEPRDWPLWYQVTLENHDFGHTLYNNVLTWAAAENSKNLVRYQEGSPPGVEYTPIEVNLPLVPLSDSFSISYSANTELNVSNAKGDDDRLLMHLHPIGTQVLASSEKLGTSDYYAFIPSLDKSGYLYIGLNQTPDTGSVSILFEVAAVDSPDGLEAATVRWDYLTGDGWAKFSTDRQMEGNLRAMVLADGTNGLINTGIMRFQMVTDMRRNGAFAGDHQLWLRASLENVDSNIQSIWSRLKGIYTQAAAVVFSDQQKQTGQALTPKHLPEPLPPETITALYNNDPAIAAVTQPLPSSGGRAPEAPDTFNNRVSERLRHRGRAINSWDYERLVLEEFPELFMARCVRGQEAGSVVMQVIPKTTDPTLLKPRAPLFLQNNIYDFLEPLIPPQARVSVTTPRFQEVRFSISVNIREGYDQGLMIQTLNKELVTHLSPWTSANSGDFKNSISLTSIARFVAARPYVEQVLKITAKRQQWDSGSETLEFSPVAGPVIYPDDLLGNPEEVILVPARLHTINVLPSGVVIFEGLGRMEIELDFEVAP